MNRVRENSATDIEPRRETATECQVDTFFQRPPGPAQIARASRARWCLSLTSSESAGADFESIALSDTAYIPKTPSDLEALTLTLLND
jgi:hypothetical protein